MSKLLLLALPAFLASTEPSDESRHEQALRLRHALRASGVGATPAVEHRLATLSDRELAELVQASDAVGRHESPALIIAASLILLALLVAVLAATA